MRSKFYWIALVFIVLFAACQKEDKMLIAGSGFKKVVEIDKETKQVVWEHNLPAGAECNQVNYTPEGNILYAYQKGAALINRDNEILWQFIAEDKAEVQSASVTKEGNMLIGQCGNPAKIMEFNSKGEKTLEITFQPEQKRPHGQFRRVMKHTADAYFAILLNGTILKMDRNGKIEESHKVGERAFDLEIINESRWIVTCGDSHEFVEYNPITKNVEKRISNEVLENVKLKFAAEVIADGQNILIGNWGGHDRKSKAQAQLIEFDKNYNIVWQFKDEKVGNISAIGIK